MSKTIANQKGGVGKTTTAASLGVGLTRQGKEVLLIDADRQGDLTSTMGWEADELDKTLAEVMSGEITENYERGQRTFLLRVSLSASIHIAVIVFSLFLLANLRRLFSFDTSGRRQYDTCSSTLCGLNYLYRLAYYVLLLIFGSSWQTASFILSKGVLFHNVTKAFTPGTAGCF